MKLTEKQTQKIEKLGVQYGVDPFTSTPKGLRQAAKGYRRLADGIDKILAIIAPAKPKKPAVSARPTGDLHPY